LAPARSEAAPLQKLGVQAVPRRLTVLDWLLPISLIGSLGFSYVVYDSRPAIYTSHLLMAITMVTVILTSRKWLVTPSFVFTTLWILMVSLVGLGTPRFLPEFTKLIFVAASYFLFLQVFYFDQPKTRLIALSFVVGMTVSTITPSDSYDITTLYRSPDVQRAVATYNTYGFTIATSLILCAYLFVSNTSYIARLMTLSAGTYLSVVLITTFSRGALLSLIGGLLAAVTLVIRNNKPGVHNAGTEARSGNPKQRKGHSRLTQLMVYAAAFALIVTSLLERLTANYDLSNQNVTNPFWLLINRFEDTTGSGRNMLWRLLVDDLLKSPVNLVFGKGVGSIDSEFLSSVLLPDFNSSHSLYVDSLYQFGLLGLGGLLWFFYATFRGLLRQPLSSERTLMIALLMQMIVGSLFDSYYATSQFAWTFGFWFAMFWASITLNGHARRFTPGPLSSPRRLLRDHAQP